MPNARYEKSKSKTLNGEISWNNDNIKVAVLGPTYAGGFSSLEDHEFFSDIASYVLTGTTPIVTLTTKAVIIGTKHGHAKADDVLFEDITAGQTISYLVIFKDSGAGDGVPATPGTSPLIAMFDSGYGIGSGTNGGDIAIAWDVDNGIFKI